MGVRFLGIGRNKARNLDRIRKYGSEADRRVSMMDRTIGSMLGRANDAYQEDGQTTEERFGNEIDRGTDRIMQNKASATDTIENMLYATGGDVTGAGAASLNQVNESANQQVGDLVEGYSSRNDAINRREVEFAKNRGDRLTQIGARLESGLLNNAMNRLSEAELREIQRKTANKQLVGDFIGAVGNAVGGAMGG